MKNIILACVVLALSACGGGAGDGSLSAPPDQVMARRIPHDRTLVPGEVSLVNATTAGQQVLRSIGASADGGYTVAWVSNDNPLYLQRYDSAGQKLGGETLVPLVAPANQQIVITAVSVLTDGGVVVAYRNQTSSLEPDGLVHTRSGIFIQRFDAGGVQVQAETEVASRFEVVHYRSPLLGNMQTAALQDGGFVVAWTLSTFSAQFGSISTLYLQRYDSQGQPVGATVTVGSFPALGYELTADAHGGFTLTLLQQLSTFSIIHYDANQVARQLAVPTTGSALALPLEGRYVLFASDSTGAWQQMLDSSGNPSGPQTPISAVPDLAAELADGTYMLFWAANGSVTAQRYDSSGASMGDLMTISIGAPAPGVTALLDGGFALAWTAATAPGDLDVYTQRFIEILDNQRKACLDSARGLRGHERKAFMTACLG
jgi:hypothetical protein